MPHCYLGKYLKVLNTFTGSGGAPHRYLAEDVNQISEIPVIIDIGHKYSMLACFCCCYVLVWEIWFMLCAQKTLKLTII